jgi:putative Mn2+ efflux pump MntP
MDLATILLIAFGLSMDSFAVSISSGLMLPSIKFNKAMIIALSLAFFQGFMPFLGWTMGLSMQHYLTPIDHWIAFILLAGLGIRMIISSIKPDEERECFNPLKPSTLIIMSIATSIDALIVGMSLAFVHVPEKFLWMAILIPVLIIASVTFTMSMLGILFGKKVGNHLGKKMEMAGGILLFVIGARILVEHLFFM